MNTNDLIPYETIFAAKKGDPDAMNTILQYFDRYITHYSRCTYIDDQGTRHTFVDEELKSRIRLKLMMAIISDFDVDSLPPGETLED